MIATPHALAGAFASRFARNPRGADAAASSATWPSIAW